MKRQCALHTEYRSSCFYCEEVRKDQWAAEVARLAEKVKLAAADQRSQA